MKNNEKIRKIVEDVSARPGLIKDIGARVLSADVGHVTMALDRRPGLLQLSGYFHGGVISALADHAAAAAVTSALPEGRVALTIDLHVNFLAPAEGDLLLAHAKAIRIGGLIGAAYVEVEAGPNDEVQLCAIATATMRSTPMPSPNPPAINDPWHN